METDPAVGDSGNHEPADGDGDEAEDAEFFGVGVDAVVFDVGGGAAEHDLEDAEAGVPGVFPPGFTFFVFREAGQDGDDHGDGDHAEDGREDDQAAFPQRDGVDERRHDGVTRLEVRVGEVDPLFAFESRCEASEADVGFAFFEGLDERFEVGDLGEFAFPIAPVGDGAEGVDFEAGITAVGLDDDDLVVSMNDDADFDGSGMGLAECGVLGNENSERGDQEVKRRSGAIRHSGRAFVLVAKG